MKQSNIIRKENIDANTFLPNRINPISIQLPFRQPLKSDKTEKEIIKGNTNFQFIIRKRGRKNKSIIILKSEGKKDIHDKFSNDNIKRKIKSLYNRYIINLLNNMVKKTYKNYRMKFLKMNIRITKDIGIKYNKNLLNQSIKDIIINVSNKYKNKDNNKNLIKFIENQTNNEEILNILNMTYKDLYINYYLKSTKINSSENSFESHKEKLLILHGKEYLDKFIENAEHFVEFFINSKNRKPKKFQEIDIIDIPIENEKIETTSNSIESVNNVNTENKELKIKTVSTSTQTEICDINSKIIAFS